jgi:hypothetical protein
MSAVNTRHTHMFKVGDRVRLTEYARQCFIGTTYPPETTGTVTKVDRFNSPTVLWDHRKTASGYHPDFIEPVSERRPKP